MSKNRKAFVYVLQFDKKNIRGVEKVIVTARIYRIMRNVPKFIGFTKYQCRLHELHVLEFLKKKGHIRPTHEMDRDFMLEAV